MALALGVDSSTQSTKVEVRDVDTGVVVATGRAGHPPTEPPVSEQDPVSWWDALVAAVRQLGRHRDDVTAIAVAGQQHGLVLVDETGEVIRPAKLWNDTTSARQAEELVERLGADAWARACGSVPVASFTITKLAWMLAEEPRALHATARVMLPHDYLTWRLTDRHVTDRGDASGTGWFDPAAGCYRSDLLGSVVDDPEEWCARLPEVLGPDEAAGTLTDSAADALGLARGIVVGPGTGDNMAAALGLGLRSGDIAMSLGTSGTIYAVSDVPTSDATGAVAGFADATGRFLPLVCTLNATRVTDSVAQWLSTDSAGLSELALTVPAGAAGPVLVPYFDGERTPNLPSATGLLGGLRTTTTRQELARAAHDGVLCGLLAGLDALRETGVEAAGRLHLIGGGARSAAYRQRCADLHGAPIVVPSTDETVATGASLQAAAVSSDLSTNDLAETWRLGIGMTIEPDPESNGEAVRAAYTQLASGLDQRRDQR